MKIMKELRKYYNSIPSSLDETGPTPSPRGISQFQTTSLNKKLKFLHV
jgi:hypothetical protein